MTPAPTAFAVPTAAGDAKVRLTARMAQEWGPGTRLPPIRQLARILNLGIGSLNRAIQELAAEGHLVSKPKLGTYVADRPAVSADTPARTFRASVPARTSASVARKRVLVGTSQCNPEMMPTQMRDALVAALQDLGVDTVLGVMSPLGAIIGPVPEVDALVAINANSTGMLKVLPHQVLLELNTASGGVVIPGTRHDLVSLDQTQGGFLAGQHLRACGATGACFVGVCNQQQQAIFDRTSGLRLWGFEEGWGQPVPAAHQLREISYGESHGAFAVSKWAQLSPCPQAIFAASDELAVGFVKGALGLGLLPGRDYQIVGFDGQQRSRDLHEGPLTTVLAPLQAMAQRGAELLLDRLQNPDQPTRRLQLGVSLFVGKTTKSLVTSPAAPN